MKAFTAIVKLTFRNALRSHIFQLLLFVLLLCIVFIPNAITGDGTAHGYIRISLKYSVAAVAFILSLSAVWLGCYTMSRDIESYQLHMIISKPVSRVTIWLSKWFSICLIHLLLLAVASTVVYFAVVWQFYRQPFTPEEKEKIENEVMVGRRVFMPEFPDVQAEAQKRLREKITQLQAQGKNIDTSAAAQEKMLKELHKQVIMERSEILPGKQHIWQYQGLPSNHKEPLYLRYRIYVNKVSSEAQRITRGLWVIGVPRLINEESKNVFEQKKAKGWELFYTPYTQQPQQIMCGVFHEFSLPPAIISPDGTAFISFVNLDSLGGAIFAQPLDGPKLLIKKTGFAGNYFRAVCVIFMQIAILAGLGCAAASIFSMPMAVFMVVSYLLFGSFAKFMVGTTYFGSAADYVGYYVGKLLLLIIIPIQDFEVTGFVASGELIELAVIGKLLLIYFVYRALPLFLLGIWLYRRREMGLVIRK